MSSPMVRNLKSFPFPRLMGSARALETRVQTELSATDMSVDSKLIIRNRTGPSAMMPKATMIER